MASRGAKPPVVALVGRANVGKSTLFNALVGQRIAVTEDYPGVTRDRSYALVNDAERPFLAADTGGLFLEDELGLQEAIERQVRYAVQESDLVLALFDGVAGPHPSDHDLVRYLRETGKPILWVINKCEKESSELAAAEFYGLGIEDVLPISAAHRKGLRELVRRIRERLPAWHGTAEAAEEEKGPLRIAVVGKPNVGKSTFINKIVGSDRVVTSPHAGTTRESVDIPLRRDGRDLVLIDTAGLRRKARVEPDSVERFANLRSLDALSRADVALLLIDATQGVPAEQDAKLASLIHERGIPFLIVVNKWDAIEKDHRTATEFKRKVTDVFRFAKYAPILFVSAMLGTRCPKVLQKAVEISDTTQSRVQTAQLNRVLNEAFHKNPPPLVRGEPLKLYFATQVSSTPPTFVLFVNHPRRLQVGYLRYLKNALRDAFPFEGSNIKILVRKRRQQGESEGAEERG